MKILRFPSPPPTDGRPADAAAGWADAANGRIFESGGPAVSEDARILSALGALQRPLIESLLARHEPARAVLAAFRQSLPRSAAARLDGRALGSANDGQERTPNG